jgi:hypothetical protein
MSSHFGLTYLLEYFIALGAGRQTLGLRARFLSECRKPVLERYSLNEVTPQHIDDLPDVVRRAIAVRAKVGALGVPCRVTARLGEGNSEGTPVVPVTGTIK